MAQEIQLFLTDGQLKKATQNKTFQISASNADKEPNCVIKLHSKADVNRLVRNMKNKKGFRFSANKFDLIESSDHEKEVVEGGRIRWKKIGRTLKKTANNVADGAKKATYQTGDALKSKDAVGVYKVMGKTVADVGIDYAGAMLPSEVKAGLKSVAHDAIDGKIKKASDMKGVARRAALSAAKDYGKNRFKDQLKSALEKPADKVLDETTNAMHGGAIKGKFAKGSQAAKDHMARIRAMRGKKTGGSFLAPDGKGVECCGKGFRRRGVPQRPSPRQPNEGIRLAVMPQRPDQPTIDKRLAVMPRGHKAVTKMTNGGSLTQPIGNGDAMRLNLNDPEVTRNRPKVGGFGFIPN